MQNRMELSHNFENGFDLLNLNKFFADIVKKIRTFSKPILVEVQTRRYNEHVGPGEDFDAGYRSLEDINNWKSKDCLITDKKLIKKFSSKIETEIDDAVNFAETTLSPTAEELLTDVK